MENKEKVVEMKETVDTAPKTEAVCEGCGCLKSACTCIKGFVTLNSECHIKEKISLDEIMEIVNSFLYVYINGADIEEKGKKQKDKYTFNGYNFITAEIFLYKKLCEMCIKEYDEEKFEEYVQNGLPETIMTYTKGVKTACDLINVKLTESSQAGNQIKQVAEQIPRLIRELLDAVKDIDEEKMKLLMNSFKEGKSMYDEITKETPKEEVIEDKVDDEITELEEIKEKEISNTDNKE